MCAAFHQHFAQLFGGVIEPDHRIDFTSNLEGLPWLSVTEAGRCERLITAFEIPEAIAIGTMGKLPC